MRMLRARAVSFGKHDTRAADVFPGPHSGTEGMPNFLDGRAIAVVKGAQSISDEKTNICRARGRIGNSQAFT